jgi:hypothetical protein
MDSLIHVGGIGSLDGGGFGDDGRRNTEGHFINRGWPAVRVGGKEGRGGCCHG